MEGKTQSWTDTSTKGLSMPSCWDLNLDECQWVDLYSENVLDRPSLIIKLKRPEVALSAFATVGCLYLRVPESHWESVGWTETGGKRCFFSFSVNDLPCEVQLCPGSVSEPKTFALSLSPSNNSFYCLKFHMSNRNFLQPAALRVTHSVLRLVEI